jgi:hypothetical protein
MTWQPKNKTRFPLTAQMVARILNENRIYKKYLTHVEWVKK